MSVWSASQRLLTAILCIFTYRTVCGFAPWTEVKGHTSPIPLLQLYPLIQIWFLLPPKLRMATSWRPTFWLQNQPLRHWCYRVTTCQVSEWNLSSECSARSLTNTFILIALNSRSFFPSQFWPQLFEQCRLFSLLDPAIMEMWDYKVRMFEEKFSLNLCHSSYSLMVLNLNK